jgi:hypothetical protein
MEAIGKLLESLGFAAPLLYAAAAYGLFNWLDENLSDAAKAALASTMKLKDSSKEQVASALVEVFDRIYTAPLLSWRAFARSLQFTTVVLAIYLFELHRLAPDSYSQGWDQPLKTYRVWGLVWLFNVLTDYLSLFVIRSLLIRSGTRPVIGLALGTLSGAAIVYVANVLRFMVYFIVMFVTEPNAFSLAQVLTLLFTTETAYVVSPGEMVVLWPAMAVFIWLPLFALGILAIRALTPLSWIVENARWALKGGDQHPLRAIGCVAAVAVFALAVGWRTMIAVAA